MTKYGENSFEYNHTGARTSKYSSNGESSHYYLDGNKILAEYIYKEGSKIPIEYHYFYNALGIAGVKYGNKEYNFLLDGNGSVSKVFCQGRLIGEYNYDSLGNSSKSLGNGYIKYWFADNDEERKILEDNPFRWKSYYRDKETGFYLIPSDSGSRYYDPEIGQFLSPSPIENFNPMSIDSLNLYGLGVRNPLLFPANYANINTSISLVADPTAEGSNNGGLFDWIPNWAKWTVGRVIIAGCIIAIPFTGGTSSLFIPAAIGAGTSATIGVAVSGLSFQNSYKWDWDKAADAFMWGSITGAAAGYLGGYVGNPDMGFSQIWRKQGLWNAGINMGLTSGQQLLTTGTIDPLAVGISGVFGFAGGAIGVTSFGQYASGVVSGFGLGIAEALAGTLYDDFIANAQVNNTYLMYLLGLRKSTFTYY